MSKNKKLKNKYRKLLSFLTTLCITAGLVLLFSISASANPGGGGSGSVSDPWLINNLAELQEFRNRVNNGTTYLNQHIRLTANISLSDIDNWTPIGNTETRTFRGTFDGNGHTVSGMNISGGGIFRGLFGNIGTNGSISNLGVININITGSAGSVGGIAGSNSGIIQNSYVTGNITSSGSNIGGISGENLVGGTVRRCYANIAIRGSHNVGGIVGINQSTVTFCYTMGTVQANTNNGGSGGIVGNNVAGATVSNNVALQTRITVPGSNVGRIVGTTAGTRSNNRALSDMQVLINGSQKTPLNNTLAGVDGQNVISGTTPNANVFSGWDSNIWNIPDGELDLNNLLTLRVFERTVTYDGNGATDGSVPIGGTFQNNSTTTALGAGTLEREGYRFVGWNTEADGRGTAVSAGDTFTITGDITLYAQWRVNPAKESSIRANEYDDMDVQARIVDLTTPVYKIDIEWGDMKFTFSTESATWNSDTREFEDIAAAGWSGFGDGNNQIVVSNHSNADVRVSFAVSNIEFGGDVDMEVLQSNAGNGDAAVNMELGKVPLPNEEAPNIEAYLRLSGEPPAAKIEELKNADAWHKIGIITVTITPDGDMLTPLL